MSKKIEYRGYILIIISVFIWSIGEIIIKTIQDHIGAYSYIFLRMIIGSSFLFGVLALQKDISGIGKLVKNNLNLMLVTCCFILAFSNILYFVGISNTQANMGAVLCSTSPVWITILAFFILNEKNNLKTKSIGILMGVIGVTILLTELNLSGFISSEYIFGNILALGAEITWSLFSVLGKRIQENEKNTTNHEVKFTALALIFASVPIFMVLIFSPEFASFLTYSLDVWFFIILMGIANSAIAYWLFFKGLREVDTSKGASLIFLKPIIATILAFLFLAEAPTIYLVVASILIIIAIYLINLKSKMEEEIVISF